MASTITNVATELSIQAAENTAVDTLLSNLGFWLGLTEGATPLWPFVALGLAVFDLVSLFGGGRPEFRRHGRGDHAVQGFSLLATARACSRSLDRREERRSDLRFTTRRYRRNSARGSRARSPASRDLPAYTAGPRSPGYWQLQQLINLSWVWSKGGQQQVISGRQGDRPDAQ